MGIRIESCSCLRKSDDEGTETDFKVAIPNGGINGTNHPKMIQANAASYSKDNSKDNYTFGSNKLTKITKQNTFDSQYTSKFSHNLRYNSQNVYNNNNELKGPQVKFQALIRGVLFRKKFNKANGIKIKLIDEKNNFIKSKEKEFIPKWMKNAQKLFSVEYLEDTVEWKKENKNKNNNLLKTECLLLKYNGQEAFYRGEIESNDKINGIGELYLKKGKKYEGKFINGRLNGYGRHIDSDGTCYEGPFQNNVLSGEGEIIKTDENSKKVYFKGQIRKFMKEGKGTEQNDEFIYEGEFHNNLKNGEGKLVYYNCGDEYEGHFTNGSITGYGFYKWNNGHTYLGDFFDGKMHGKGLYKWPDGSQYKGDYISNIKEGQGEFMWKDGRIFKGSFKGGKPHGEGILTIKDISINARFNQGKFVGDLKSILKSKRSEESSKQSEK